MLLAEDRCSLNIQIVESDLAECLEQKSLVSQIISIIESFPFGTFEVLTFEFWSRPLHQK
jgi:hypothetical protein